MNKKKVEALAEVLKGLACKGGTEGWLEKHDAVTDPSEDIRICAAFGFISSDLEERLVGEVQEIKSEAS